MASRNQVKAQAAVDELKRETGREAIFLRVDLASLKSVRVAAEEFLRYGCPVLPVPVTC